MYNSSSAGQQQKRSYNGLSKINQSQIPELTQASDLDISREDVFEMLNSSSNDKFLIKWSNNYSEQVLNNQLMKVKPIIHTKIIDYFASLPDYDESDSSGGGFLTQACQFNSFQNLNQEPYVKKPKTNCVNEEKIKRKLIINSLLSNMNEFFKNHDFEEKPEETDLNLNTLDSLSSPIKDQQQYQNSEFKPKFKPLLSNDSNSVRTSTPRANKLKTRQFSPNGADDDEQLEPLISDESLVIAATQVEKKELIEKKVAPPPPVKKFNFTSNNSNEKSFTRFKSDPIPTVSSAVAANERKRLTSHTVYNHENVRNRKNIYSSSQTNALNSIKTKNTNNDDDDDDDDINLLLNNKNLLEIIDSKCDESKQAKTNNNHLNDTFNRNLIVKKVPSSSHLQQSVAANKVIQVPTNNCNLKMPRMSSSEQMTATATTNVAKQLTNITNKNFYGSNSTTAAATSTQKTSDRKYSPAEIEQKRQQALLRLQNKQNKK